ncbi:DNA alkylation repair protein [Candidatus Gottesmanbacteria bacterium RBG_16_37_8]|uniref:DNA alkylation repair protein n=1 Tax=Candidatus Gottesmanbacteria bacterium RBG_16_37_8 TaxID=1798371 RepID=A0A1F5YTZ1_9BACT|nr:MAG: DNA alkylation repair protein [Candidatus Gottesmanbacteria bacterium RBG_16_37_8]
MLDKLVRDLNKLKNPQKAKLLARFFKTGKGEYGEGDIFFGLTVPQQRSIAKRYSDLTVPDLQELIDSPIHEYRLISLLIIVEKYKKGNFKEKEKIVDFYLKNTSQINNWDLVDLSAEKILGDYLMDKDKSIIYKLTESANIWERRISILTTFQFIKNKKYDDTLKISEILLKDKHDLIHKAVGWMLREIGKRDQKIEEIFLQKYYKIMPRTMLRYAIERFNESKKKYYLNK